ncbi:unnamed protein product [Paramecium sonneborni]|uniref:Uncharacterized protein n=1 Tax=Paramecium sonneborni TaxID=65129 RepID=A0A8S1QE03_9CILI|nr:unnamed protein product [Paramecium sonneborni]
MQENEFAISICVPSFKKNDDVVYYQLTFTEQNQRCSFSVDYRYSYLKNYINQQKLLKGFCLSFLLLIGGDPPILMKNQQRREEFSLIISIKFSFYAKSVKNKEIEFKLIRNKKLSSIKKEKQELFQILIIFSQTKKRSSQLKLNKKQIPETQLFSPIEDSKDRSRSWKFKFTKKKSLSICSKENNQLNNLIFGGAPIFKGIILKLK